MKKNEQYTFTGTQPLQMYDQLTLVSNVYLPVVTMMVDDMADKCEDRAAFGRRRTCALRSCANTLRKAARR